MKASTNSTPRPHVLVIDDEEDLCELLALRLEYHDFRVTTAQTARDGIEALEREAVDVIILDLRLDGHDDLDLLSLIVSRHSDLPVVILTAHGTIETAVDATKRGAYGFLTKPFDDRDLLQKLRQAVERYALRREVAGLRRLVGESGKGSRLLGASAPLCQARDLIMRAARTDANVLILGESGTGKEVAARSIHEMSQRASKPFVAINCGALPRDLLESELFGYVKGAFTGAHRNKEGLFAAAEGGTLFLDEVGEAPASVQVKLLRVLQERTYWVVGATDPVATDVRIIAATNRDLRDEVAMGTFREDLFYRLHVVPLSMPPLRECSEDIPLLAEVFLSRAAAQHGLPPTHLTSDALSLLLEHDWPGNVRELANVVEGAAVLGSGGRLRAEHVAAVISRRGSTIAPSDTPKVALSVPLAQSPEESFPSLRGARDAFDRLYLEEVLRRSAGNVSAAAKLACRNRTDFHDLLRRHEIVASEFRDGRARES